MRVGRVDNDLDVICHGSRVGASTDTGPWARVTS